MRRRARRIVPTAAGWRGLSRGLTRKDFDPKELRRGTRVEREHFPDKRLAERVAMDHLVEDPRYYRKLAKMEGRKRS